MYTQRYLLLQTGDKTIHNKTKMGGSPDWIQGAKEIICNKCNRPMSLWCQIDSSFDKINDYIIYDSGIIYLFHCSKCNDFKTIIESY